MARHTKVILKKTYDGNSETDPSDTLAKAVNDLVATKTIQGISICRYGINCLCIIVYDD